MRELYQISPALKLAAYEDGRTPLNRCGLSSPVSEQQATGKSPEPAGWKACDTVRFIENLLSFFACIGTMYRSVGTPLVWSPAFRRSGPAKAGTPNGRFMESEAFLAGRGRTRRSLLLLA